MEDSRISMCIECDLWKHRVKFLQIMILGGRIWPQCWVVVPYLAGGGGPLFARGNILNYF